MDQAGAKQLFADGAFFIFLEVPEGTEFGIDMKSWTTGEKFRGVKMIPPGIHYIFYSSVSDTEEIAPRTGFFHNFKKSEVVVRKWDKIKEDICDDGVSDAEIVHLKENILALDEFLGPYPYIILDKWNALTSNITDNLLNNLMPLSGLVKSALELEPCSDHDRPRGKKKTENNEEGASTSTLKKPRISEDMLPALKPIAGTALRLHPLPEKNYPDEATPAEITQHSLDKTYVFEQQLRNYSSASEIIGEMEFCFICFLVGHSLEAFEQWKKMVTVMCSCDLAIKKYRQLYDIFISMLEIQIKEIPEEFLADIVSNNNFLYVHLRKLFSNVQNSDTDGQLKSKVGRFKNALTTTYLWDFGHLDSEAEDEAPVIVDTTC